MNFQKIKLIISREYWSRVTSKSFILSTVLVPLGLALYFVAVGFITNYRAEDDKRIVVIDKDNLLNWSETPIKDEHGLYFRKSEESLNEMKAKVKAGTFDAIMEMPSIQDLKTSKYTLNYYTADSKPLSLVLINKLERAIEQRLRNHKIRSMGLDSQQIASIDTDVNLETKPIEEKGETSSVMASMIATGIGGFMGIFMYLAVLLYGSMVMRGVMEEKTNRIVEVMISTVKPFELMLGKIIGIGLVGLSQLFIWAVMFPAVILATQAIFGTQPPPQDVAALAQQGMSQAEVQSNVFKLISELQSYNWAYILGVFVIFFLGGYFLYSSLFAAVGAFIGDDMGEAQSLTFPIALPLMVGFFLMFPIIQSPFGNLARWASIFPFFSPILMPARLAFSPPLWEVLLAIVLLLATAFGIVWLSGRIYRVGILMYGKKASFKEVWRWVFSAN